MVPVCRGNGASTLQGRPHAEEAEVLEMRSYGASSTSPTTSLLKARGKALLQGSAARLGASSAQCSRGACVCWQWGHRQQRTSRILAMGENKKTEQSTKRTRQIFPLSFSMYVLKFPKNHQGANRRPEETAGIFSVPQFTTEEGESEHSLPSQGPCQEIRLLSPSRQRILAGSCSVTLSNTLFPGVLTCKKQILAKEHQGCSPTPVLLL